MEVVVCIPLHQAGTIQAENLSHGNATMQPWDDLPVTATKRADRWGSGRMGDGGVKCKMKQSTPYIRSKTKQKHGEFREIRYARESRSSITDAH